MPTPPHKTAWAGLALLSLLLLAASVWQWVPLGLTEVFGFITGAVCVLLCVEQNIWNFPVGLANNVVFIVLFLQSRLYADMTLQVVYIGLGIAGWYEWLRGGERHTARKITHTPLAEWLALLTFALAATWAMRLYLCHIKDAAPFLDALTTVMSLCAQWLLNRKRLEHWYVWIAADIIYVGLYTQRELYLTALLYAGFIGLCLAGLRAWRHDLPHTDTR